MLLQADTTCWRVEQAERAAVIIDMADYFTAAKAAMLKAKRSIHFLNWAFDPDTLFDPKPGGEGPDNDRIGPFLASLAEDRPHLDIRILCWKAALPISATQNFFTLKDRTRFAGTSVKFKLDGRLPRGASHHQKVIVIDDRLAFCGGGDIGPDRWDTVDHVDGDRRRWRKKGQCYDSRHELMSAVEGDPARSLGELFRDRWLRATGEAIPPPEGPARGSPWPACLTPTFGCVRTGISRTQARHGEAPELRENEALFLASIAKAKRLIYLENQYMTSPIMAEALAARLAEPKGPEVVLVSTLHCPSWFDQMTMDRTRTAFIKRLELANHHRRLHAFCPVTAGGKIIIVHAKLAIIDDDLIRIGSANLNNRSYGFDTECDLSIEASGPDAPLVRQRIRELLTHEVAHWLGIGSRDVAQAVEAAGSLGRAIAMLQAGGAPRLRLLEPRPIGPLATFVAAHHIGDPIGQADSWRPWRRKRDMERKLQAQKRELASAGLKAPRTTRIKQVV